MKIFSSVWTSTDQEKECARFFEHKQAEKGHLWFLAHFPFIPTKADALEKRLQQVFHTHIFGDHLEEDAEMVFENALKEANEVLPQLMGEDAETVLKQGSLILAFLRGDELLISSYGNGGGILLRNNSIIHITEGLSPSDSTAESFQNVSSGDVQEGDRLLLCTQAFDSFFTDQQLRTLLDDGVTEAKEEILTHLNYDDSGAFTVLHVKSESSPSFSLPETPTGFSRERKTPWYYTLHHHSRKALSQAQRRIQSSPNRPHLLLAAAAVLGILLISSFFLFASEKQEAEQTGVYSDFVTSAEQQFADVDARHLQGDAQQANLILDRIEKTASEMINNRVDIENAQKILLLSQSKRESINNIMRITNPDLVSDLSQITSDIAAKGLLFFDNALFSFDSSSLYRTLIAGEAAESVGSIATREIISGTVFGAKKALLFLLKDGGILEWKDGQAIAVDTADTTWKSGIDIATYSKYAYILDPQSKQIWKYERRESGFTIPDAWVSADNDFLRDAVSFAIDGSIFVINSTGEIKKYHRGAQIPYTVRDVPKNMTRADKIYTNEDLSFFLVLDAEQNSLFVFSKFDTEAVYQKQITLENVGDIQDVYAQENKIYILSKTRIFEVPLSGI